MAERNCSAFGQFNFLVRFGDGTGEPDGGFQEASGFEDGEVRLKRGAVRSTALRGLTAAADDGAERSVTITLQAEDRARAVASWTLLRPQIIKHTGPSLNAEATDVAVEELVLGHDGVEVGGRPPPPPCRT